mmetsp:Transcript_2575/g.6117  ORF Transcript_2575/g.6117 Transcript_2575/m.6117 type:complete len:255 (-) Transcript_2575:650-1414(-)
MVLNNPRHRTEIKQPTPAPCWWRLSRGFFGSVTCTASSPPACLRVSMMNLLDFSASSKSLPHHPATSPRPFLPDRLWQLLAGRAGRQAHLPAANHKGPSPRTHARHNACTMFLGANECVKHILAYSVGHAIAGILHPGRTRRECVVVVRIISLRHLAEGPTSDKDGACQRAQHGHGEELVTVRLALCRVGIARATWNVQGGDGPGVLKNETGHFDLALRQDVPGAQCRWPSATMTSKHDLGEIALRQGPIDCDH